MPLPLPPGPNTLPCVWDYGDVPHLHWAASARLLYGGHGLCLCLCAGPRVPRLPARHVNVNVHVNVFSLGLSNATEEQQVYSAIWV